VKATVKFLTTFEHIFDRFIFIMAIAATVSAAGIMVATLVGAVTRWMRTAVVGLYEMNAFLVGITVFLALAYTQSQRNHITVRFVIKRLPDRVVAILDIVLLAISLAFFAWASYLYYQEAHNAIVIHEVTEGIAHWPTFPFKLVIFSGVAILAIQLLVDIISRLYQIMTASGLHVSGEKVTSKTEELAE